MKSKIYYLAALCMAFFMGCETNHESVELFVLTITKIHDRFQTEEYTSRTMVQG